MTEQNAIVVKDKMTLPEILSVFDAMDRGIIELSLDQMQEMGEKAAVKVDHYKEFLDRCECEANRLKERAFQFSKAANQIQSTASRVEKMMLYFLQRGKFEKMTGNDWIVKIKKTSGKSVNQLTEEEPSSAIFARHPKFVRRKYEWNKKAIGESLKSSKPDPWLENRFEIKVSNNENIDWEINGGIEK